MFCLTSPNLEDYRGEEHYRNELIKHKLMDVSDIQELVILLHEASHYLYKKSNAEVKHSQSFKELSEIYYMYLQDHRYDLITLRLMSGYKNDSDVFLQECYCDFESIQYILKIIYRKKEICDKELFVQFFRSILSTYLVCYIMTGQSKYPPFYNYYEMQQLLYRMGNIYCAILSFLTKYGQQESITILNETYDQCREEFKKCIKKFRIFLQAVEDEETEEIEDELKITNKYEFIREYLMLA